MQIGVPDIRLMLEFRDGDESALSEFYRIWSGPLLRYLERIVRERETPEERRRLLDQWVDPESE